MKLLPLPLLGAFLSVWIAVQVEQLKNSSNLYSICVSMVSICITESVPLRECHCMGKIGLFIFILLNRAAHLSLYAFVVIFVALIGETVHND